MEEQELDGTNGRRPRATYAPPPPNWQEANVTGADAFFHEVDHTAAQSEEDELIRRYLLDEASKKPARALVQFDYLDSEDAWYTGCQLELRRTDIPIRVQIMVGTGRETILRELARLQGFIAEHAYDFSANAEWVQHERARLLHHARQAEERARAETLMASLLDTLAPEDAALVVRHQLREPGRWSAVNDEYPPF